MSKVFGEFAFFRRSESLFPQRKRGFIPPPQLRTFEGRLNITFQPSRARKTVSNTSPPPPIVETLQYLFEMYPFLNLTLMVDPFVRPFRFFGPLLTFLVSTGVLATTLLFSI